MGSGELVAECMKYTARALAGREVLPGIEMESFVIVRRAQWFIRTQVMLRLVCFVE